MTFYIVVPWDLQSCNPALSCFKQLHTLEEVANAISGPADCVVAFDDGQERRGSLSGSWEAELKKLLALKLATR